MNNRSQVFIIALNVMLAFFILRLIGLQLVENEKYKRLSMDNAAHTTPILAPRGIIFDKYGKVMLKNHPVFMAYLRPHLLPDDPKNVLHKLGEILKMDPGKIHKKYIERKTPLSEGILIASNLPTSVVSRIEEDRDGLPGVEVICFPLRSYPYKKVASHILGFVGEIDKNELRALKNEGFKLGDLIGKDGVEKSYDKYLRGVSGGKKIEVDALGNPMRVLDIVDPVPGSNIILTVDLDLQKKVDEALGNREGAVVVIDPNSGEILAMSSHPAYDPSNWDAQGTRNHPFMNRALSSYPPGSIFKPVTLSAALETGKTTENEIFKCSGVYRLGHRIAKCWKESGHGRITPIEGLVWSCDVVFYELGKRLGPDILHEFAQSYGLGQKTGIDLPQEKRGFVPSSKWKKERFNEDWYDGDSINLGIGQGYTQVTPLQMASLFGEIAAGKRFKPYVVKKIIDNNGKILFENKPIIVSEIPIAKRFLDLIKSALMDVVFRGTGIAAYVPGNEAAGKTGTAENPGLPHAWFLSYAPAATPEVAVATFVSHGEHGDRVSAMITHDILEWYRKNRLSAKKIILDSN
ncbi:penicillin-binding protein 2 [Candidatus Saganbacteria bacterium]|nr:penicillin-binding protein 2 [Candidatus Saganbacteria bacterium]